MTALPPSAQERKEKSKKKGGGAADVRLECIRKQQLWTLDSLDFVIKTCSPPRLRTICIKILCFLAHDTVWTEEDLCGEFCLVSSFTQWPTRWSKQMLHKQDLKAGNLPYCELSSSSCCSAVGCPWLWRLHPSLPASYSHPTKASMPESSHILFIHQITDRLYDARSYGCRKACRQF